jgi:hypothetical protein
MISKICSRENHILEIIHEYLTQREALNPWNFLLNSTRNPLTKNEEGTPIDWWSQPKKNCVDW